MYLLPGEMTVTSSDDINSDLIDNQLSHNYYQRHNQEIKHKKDKNFLESVLQNITGYTLYKRGYISTENNYSFSSYRDVAKINVTLNLFDVSTYGYYSYTTTYKYDITVSLVDYFGEEYETIVNSYSTNKVEKIMEDINTNIRKLLKSKEFKNLKSSITDKLSQNFDEWNILTVSQKHPAKSKEQAINSIVSVVLDKGHGSGVIIGENGYIISNYHVVVGNDSVKIATATGDTIIGIIERVNPEYDLALIKCDTIFSHSVGVVTSKRQALKTGDEISSIGSPIDLSLYGSVSKGIIVGKRKLNNISFYQVNCSVNPGNSGGALINKNGELVGIINAKLIGFGVSKLGFAIPSYYLSEVLKVNVK